MIRRRSFRPHIHTLIGVVSLAHYEEHNRHIVLYQSDDLEPLSVNMVAIVAPGLLPSKLESGKGVVLYSPQSVLGQRGYDQHGDHMRQR